VCFHVRLTVVTLGLKRLDPLVTGYNQTGDIYGIVIKLVFIRTQRIWEELYYTYL